MLSRFYLENCDKQDRFIFITILHTIGQKQKYIYKYEFIILNSDSNLLEL